MSDHFKKKKKKEKKRKKKKKWIETRRVIYSLLCYLIF